MSDDPRSKWEIRYRRPAADLPEPSAFVVAHRHRLRGRILDVACGSGRNAAFLCAKGESVVGIDIAHAGLAQARQQTEGLAGTFVGVQADLSSYPIPAAAFDAILQVRYLQRDLFPRLIAALRPGGILLVETFLRDQAVIGHPRNPDFLLERGELLRLTAGLEVVDHQEGLFADGSGEAYLGRIVARR